MIGAGDRIHLLLRCLGYLRLVLSANPSEDLHPFNVDAHDPLSVNDAAKAIAVHSGLRGLRFVVAIGKLEPDKGGQIELKSGQTDVFIDVSSEAGRFSPSLLAVLAHEVAHKVLFDRRIVQTGDDLLAYEILTDVAAIYLGLGKLLLNGYEYASTSMTGSRSSRRTRRFGYISTDEVAFVLAMVHGMRPEQSALPVSGLSPFASRKLSKVLENHALQVHFANASRIAPSGSYL